MQNKTNNPLLRRGFGFTDSPAFAVDRMSLSGTVNKSFLLLVALLIGALYPWTHPAMGALSSSMLLGTIGGFILAIAVSFKPQWSPYLAVPYALLEGLAMGAISALFERRYPGIAIESVLLTFATFGVMLLAYRTGLIKVTNRFRTAVFAATGAIMLFYLVDMLLGFFHVHMGIVNSASPLGIGISVIIVGVAALNLALDFDMIESGVRNAAPKYYEWYSAFALTVTLVWLYMEILRLLSKVNRS